MNLDRNTLLDAYRRLKTIREFEMRMRRENEAGQVPGFIHLYCGQGKGKTTSAVVLAIRAGGSILPRRIGGSKSASA